MNRYPLINITGGDRRGKETQTRLLVNAVTPSFGITFPDYTDFSGQLVRGALFGERMTLTRHTVNGPVDMEFFIDKPNEPVTFQLIQTISRIRSQSQIADMLQHGYVFADRYQAEALAFGTEDGCDLQWLLNLRAMEIIEDLAVVFVGQQFPKPGEVADINERDTAFQKRVLERYKALSTLEPKRYALFNIDSYRNDHDPAQSVYKTHLGLVKLLNDRLDLGFQPLSFEKVQEITGIKSPQLTIPQEAYV